MSSPWVRFEAGDQIEVRPKQRHIGTDKDFGVLRGTAMETRGHTGDARFSIDLNISGKVDPTVIQLNLNNVEVRRTFDANLARSIARP